MHLSKPLQEIYSIPVSASLGRPLAPWTYANSELFDLEYEALFLNRWQITGHISDVPNAGDYMTADIGRDNVVVLRGKNGTLRAFLNVCRHRASRIFSGAGRCKGVVRCPYHGWTYRLDGSLMAIPQEENFEPFDRSNYGLHQIQLEVFHGLVFVRIEGSGPSVAQQFAHLASYFEKFDVVNYEQILQSSTQLWPVNWKVAWDNYLENYHIPVGHPGLNRLVKENGEWEELSSGVGYGVFVMNDKRSNVEVERLYQEQLHHTDHRLPDDTKGKWVQFGFAPNLGIDLYPEMLDLFQLIPIAVDKTLVRVAYYGHKNPTAEELELRRLNRLINDPINDEDLELCTNVQRGLATHGYQPGPLSAQESGVFNFHQMVRELIPVAALTDAPPKGSVAEKNGQLTQ